MGQLVAAVDALPAPDSGQPTAVVCHTVKGKGVDFMESDIGWHAGSVNPTDLARALESLRASRKELV